MVNIQAEDSGTNRCPTCGCPVNVISGNDGTSYYEPIMGRSLTAVEDENVRLRANIDSLVRELDRERQTFPAEGVFLVEHYPGGKSYMKIAQLGEFPDPVRFASVARHLDTISAAIVEARDAAKPGWIPSPRTEAEAVIRALAKAEGL